MSTNRLLETENFDNGQWPDLFCYSDSLVNKTVVSHVIDADQYYFDTNKQIQLRSDRRFIDRGKPDLIKDQDAATEFFNESIDKRTKTTKNGLFSSEFDKFRQGVEITRLIHTERPGPMITAGTPGHIIDPHVFGLNEVYSLTDSEAFQEINLFDPIEFISIQINGSPLESVITFPIVTSDVNQRENYILNGVIEPFPIRSVISFFTINFPFEPHGMTADFLDGNYNRLDGSDTIETVYKFNPTHENNRVFFDGGEEFTVASDDGTIVTLGPNTPYTWTGENNVTPFTDVTYPRGDNLLSMRSYDAELLSVINLMDPQQLTYIRTDEVSSSTGFMYDNCQQGTDSIAYGGLLRR